MVVFADSAAEPSSGLGTNGITVTPLSSKKSVKALRELRRARFTRRAQSSRWLMADTVERHGEQDAVKLAPGPATCGWAAGSLIGVHHSGGAAGFSGVQHCSSVWSCSCCGAIIRGKRSEEVQQAASWWEQQGGEFLFLTFTVRHFAEDTLERTMDAVTDAFTGLINGAPWKRLARRHGIRHFIKSQEVTLGWENGWHAHLHVLLLVDLPGAARDLAEDARLAWQESDEWAAEHGKHHGSKVKKAQRRDDDAAEALRISNQGIGKPRAAEIRGWLSERWIDMVVRAGGREPSRRRGVDVRTVRDGNVVALYVSKLQEGDRDGWGVGQEMARQDMKKGRLDSLVPLELLDVDGLTDDELERAREHWVEYVTTTKGRRAMTWSRGLKAAAGIDDVDDEQIVAEDAEETALDDLVIVIRARDWARIRHDADTVARILDLVEQDRVPEIALLVAFEYPSPPVKN